VIDGAGGFPGNGDEHRSDDKVGPAAAVVGNGPFASGVDVNSTRAALPPRFDFFVEAEAAGEATDEQIELLEANRDGWLDALTRLLDETDRALKSVRSLTGPEREQVVADYEGERHRLASALRRLDPTRAPLLAPERGDRNGDADHDSDGEGDGQIEGAHLVRLQASWSAGRVVAWAGGPQASPADAEEVRTLLAAAGAPASGWARHKPVPLPGGDRANALVVPVGDVLGWLVAIGADPSGQDVGTSVHWLSQVAAWAVKLTAQGRMVPLLRHRKGARGGEASALSVRWVPALVEAKQLGRMADAMPMAVTAFDPTTDSRSVTRSVLAAMVEAICRNAAERLEVPAPPPSPRTTVETAEAFLARLDGSRFDAPVRPATELANRLERWARPVTSNGSVRLLVQLDPPDDGGAWHLTVSALGVKRQPVPVEVALVTASSAHRQDVEDNLLRLERALPALRRPGGHRRGEVILDQHEAWELMTETGQALAGAGFEVRVPALSRRRPSPALRLHAEDSQPSVVGANQLTAVRWSAVFDDVELDAAAIARLAAEARPLVRSRGQWVALDHADLAEAAAALAERASTTQLTGAAMLRQALGLEGTTLSGGISIDGTGWAADLVARAATVTSEPMDEPKGFVGELRSYQGESLAWLSFLDAGDLGGCLALDMGLGKTPTMLAHLLHTAHNGPALVIAPPAVVGNWAAEAERFTPDLRVVVHHGTSRAAGDDLAAEVADADVVLTTYGTAVRDVDALAEIAWDRLVLDEAQIIKNPASETAQQLRRIPARTRVALTGTPIENGLGDLWAILDFTNPGLVGPRAAFVNQLSKEGENTRVAAESALRALNGILVFRRTKAEPAIAAELPERIDELDRCAMTTEQIGLYQAVLDELVVKSTDEDNNARKGQILAAITALKQICNHPAAYQADDLPLAGRSGKLARLEEIVDAVFAAGERVLVFTHFARWGEQLATHLTERTGLPVACYHGGLSRTARDNLISEFQSGKGPGALVLSLKAGGTGLNLTAASHVVLYDRWWNPAVEDQARDRAWRIGQTRTVISHRLVCPGTVDERVEEVVAGKRRIAELVLPKSSSLGDLDPTQLRAALGLKQDAVITEDVSVSEPKHESAA
jgi:hypothetical protein